MFNVPATSVMHSINCFINIMYGHKINYNIEDRTYLSGYIDRIHKNMSFNAQFKIKTLLNTRLTIVFKFSN